jgi:SAM-dependent methyltransferase
MPVVVDRVSMTHSVRRHLRLDVDEYDATIRRFIPGYETMLSVAADAVAAARPAHVVDLGAGTGGLSEAILAREEVGRVELLDVDSEMMAQARARLDRFGDRVVFTLRSYDEPFRPCHAFAASLSLHHIPTLERKAMLFARALEALVPGGVLVNADANMPDDEGERQRLYRHWADHLVASGIPEDRAWAHFEDWAEEDTYLPLDAELEALRAAGFQAEQVWSDGPIGVTVARKG